jgi:hypothetical protein
MNKEKFIEDFYYNFLVYFILRRLFKGRFRVQNNFEGFSSFGVKIQSRNVD